VPQFRSIAEILREVVSKPEMNSLSNLEFPAPERRGAFAGNRDPQSGISTLTSVAARALLALFDGKEMLFSRRIRLNGRGFHREGVSARRSVAALLGLQRLTDSGEWQPFNLETIHAAILQDTRWVKGIGDLGLLVRLAAECGRPDRVASVATEFDFANALTAFPDAREARTTDLAFFLAGISHARLACPSNLPDVTDAAVDAYRLLEANQGTGGIFAHAGQPGFLQQPYSNRFGTFADQAHAIYALATFARAFEIEEPLADALNCANAVRDLQGELGQWWFLYDKRTSKVVNRYPVWSMHQDGLAPMALLALEEATGPSFDEAIQKGLAWVEGRNELGVNLHDMEHGTIWDSIEPKSRIRKAAMSLLGSDNPGEKLQIRYEARPDHLGWLLYAFARFGIAKGATGVRVAAAGG
jgi:hypothetical protein